MAGRRGVVFDVDGTLVDSNYLHCIAWLRAFREHGYDVPAASIHRCVGMGAERLVTTLVGEPDEAVEKSHAERYGDLYRELCALPGAADLLHVVRRRGGEVVLATSAKPDEVGALLWALDADMSISVVTSAADVAAAKPEPEVFQVALRSADLEPGSAIVVGDTVWDVEAARRAGMACVGVLTGGISRAELLEAGAVAVYGGAAELLAHFDQSPLGALLD